MRTVIVDTSAFFAAMVSRDPNHRAAKRLFEQGARENWIAIATNFVVAETYTLLLNRPHAGADAAREFLRASIRGDFAVVRVEAEDEVSAASLLLSETDKAYSYVDATTFAVANRLEIASALSFDRHFRSYGRLTVLQ